MELVTDALRTAGGDSTEYERRLMSLEEFQYLITKERISIIEKRQRKAQQIREKPRLVCHYIQGSKNESVQFY